MLRYLTVAAVLLVLAGTGCSNKAEPTKSTGDRPATGGATSPTAVSTAKSEATGADRCDETGSEGIRPPIAADTPAVKPGTDVAAGDGGSASRAPLPRSNSIRP